MRIGFCVSGNGRTVEAILAARNANLLSLKGACCLLDRSTPFEAVAEKYGIPLLLAPRNSGEGREEYRVRLGKSITGLSVDGLFLSFDWLIPPFVVKKFSPNILNLHMALLPLFPGRGAISAALASGMAFAGATVHRVDEGMDTGPIVGQAITPILQAMAEEQLGRAIFKAAVPLCIQSIRWLEQGRLAEAINGRVRILGGSTGGGSVNPSLDADVKEFSNDFLKEKYPD